MKTKLISSIFMLLSFASLKAQHLNGIYIDAGNTEVIVVLNGQTICQPATSCFIANLSAGSYKINVYPADKNDRNIASNELLYFNKIRYSGKGIRRIEIPRHNDDEFNDQYQAYGHRDVMDSSDFREFLHALDKARFDDDRNNLINLLPAYTLFTSKQCAAVSEEFKFDDEKVKVLKKLYPKVVDKHLFFHAIATLTFSSNQKELGEFIKRYNDRHR